MENLFQEVQQFNYTNADITKNLLLSCILGVIISSIYKATHESWIISEKRRSILEYALSEYKGIIVGVYKINEWYKSPDGPRRWGFKGEEANDDIKKIYLNKSVKHTKKRGAANPIKYRL